MSAACDAWITASSDRRSSATGWSETFAGVGERRQPQRAVSGAGRQRVTVFLSQPAVHQQAGRCGASEHNDGCRQLPPPMPPDWRQRPKAGGESAQPTCRQAVTDCQASHPRGARGDLCCRGPFLRGRPAKTFGRRPWVPRSRCRCTWRTHSRPCLAPSCLWMTPTPTTYCAAGRSRWFSLRPCAHSSRRSTGMCDRHAVTFRPIKTIPSYKTSLRLVLAPLSISYMAS